MLGLVLMAGSFLLSSLATFAPASPRVLDEALHLASSVGGAGACLIGVSALLEGAAEAAAPGDTSLVPGLVRVGGVLPMALLLLGVVRGACRAADTARGQAPFGSPL